MRYILLFTFMPSLLFAASHIEKQIDYSEVHSIYQSRNCFDKATEQEMNFCGNKSLEASKSKMNSIFNLVISSAEVKSKSKIQKAQDDWVLYMKSNCVMETLDSEGGSAYDSIINFCYETKVNERVSYLQWILSNK